MNFNFTFYDQNEIPTSGNIITCIRDGLSSVPAISKQTRFAGIGGSGVGPHYHNIAYLSIKSLNANYPKGSVVTNGATLNLKIAKHDYKISTTWTLTACDKINNTLSGVNKPKLYSKTVTQSGFTVSGESYSIDITDLLQYLVDNGLNTIQISAPRGNNRKYIYAPSISATITTKPTTLLFDYTTDCTENSYAYNNIRVNITSSNGTYFQYKLKKNDNTILYTSQWTTQTSYTFTDLSKFSNGEVIKIEVSSSLSSNPTSLGIISSTSNINKTNVPSYDLQVSISPSVSSWKTGDCYFVSSQSAYICNQSAKITISNLTYYGIKKNFTPTIKYYIDNKEVTSNNNLFNFGSDDKVHQFKVVINNGFMSYSKTLKVIAAKPLSYTLSGDLANKLKVPCSINNQSFACTVAQNSLLPTTSNFTYTLTYTIGSTTPIRQSSNSLTSTVIPNIASYNRESAKTNIQFSIEFKNIIGQTLSGVLQTSVINRKPSVPSNLLLTRSTTDIFNRNSYTQDIDAQYSSFSIPPKDTYTLSYDKSIDSDNDNIVYRIYMGSTIIDTTPQLQYSNVYQTSAGTQNTSIGVCAYDGYNESDRTNFNIRNVASLPTPNISNIVITTSIKGEESGYNSPVNNVLYKYINIAVPNISNTNINNNTKTNELRFGYRILDTDKNNLVIQEGTSEPNSINSSSKLFTKITLNNKITNSEHIRLQIYYIDRFNLTSSYVTTSTYTIYQSPQYRLHGTQGVGYRWLLTNEPNPSSSFFGNAKLPVFYGSIKNPNNVNYTLVVHLYKDNTTTWIGDALLNAPQNNGYSTEKIPYYNTRLTITKNATTYFKFNQWLASPSNLSSSVIPSLSNGSYYVVFAIYKETPFTQSLANTNLVELSPISDDYKFIISDTYDFNGKTWSLNDFQQNQVITASHLNVLNDYVKRVYNSYAPIESDLFTPDVYRDLIIYADKNSTGVPTVNASFTTKFGNLVSIPSSTTSPHNLCDSTPTSHTSSTYVSKYCELDKTQTYLQVSVPIKCKSTTNISSLINKDWGTSKHYIKFYDEFLNELLSLRVNPYVSIPSTYGTSTSITYSVGTIIEYNEVFNSSGLNSLGATYVRVESDFSEISNNFDIDAENVFIGYVSSASGYNRLPATLSGTTYGFTPKTKQIKLDKEDLMNNLKQGLLDLRNVLYTNTHSIPGYDIVITTITPSNYDVTKNKDIVAQTSTNTTMGNINMIVMDSNNVGILNILKCF